MDLSQLNLVADKDEALKKAKVILIGKILSENFCSSNEIFMVIRKFGLLRKFLR